jgi:hypothetical protein
MDGPEWWWPISPDAANFRAMIREFPYVAEKVRVEMEARMDRTGQAAP